MCLALSSRRALVYLVVCVACVAWLADARALAEEKAEPQADAQVHTRHRRCHSQLESSGFKIPPIIHQIYFTSQTEKENPGMHQQLPPAWRESCLIHHAHWEYKLWDRESAEAFMDEHYPEYSKMFREYDKWISKSDAFRVFILHHYGGLYLDMDVECLRDGTDMLHGYDIVFQATHVEEGVANGVVASAAGHPFWLTCMDRLEKTFNNTVDGFVPYWTGPHLLTRVLHCKLHPHNCYDDDEIKSFRENKMVGDHSHNGTALKVYPLGSWFTPCWANNTACMEKFHRDRVEGVLPLKSLVGYHRYNGTWFVHAPGVEPGKEIVN